MSLGLKGKGKERGSLITAFGYAWEGIVVSIKEERNLKIHLFFFIAAIALGIFLSISKMEMLIIILASGCVISAEMMNTAIEKAVDLTFKEPHPFAKLAKDIAAGAVLVLAVISAVIGMMIFGPQILQFFE
ncbi:diacylglycerol kinase family protein [Bacillus massilinigeriensis]|uniref:diacylglycerol kinase family protein n=1 Tax=Bacillus mediterraneensis TaxID=1805474 RepID=UPI0008F8C76F|nr:diacylglycerol kinase family protein [Bacillus mediterraneensis]